METFKQNILNNYEQDGLTNLGKLLRSGLSRALLDNLYKKDSLPDTCTLIGSVKGSEAVVST